MIALKILQMHVTMNLSMALRLLDPEEGALSLYKKIEMYHVNIFLLHCIEGVDDDEEQDHQERHSARNHLEQAQLDCLEYSIIFFIMSIMNT